jgi:serine protease
VQKRVIRPFALAIFLLLLTAMAPLSNSAAHAAQISTGNPYAPAYQHSYRHGALPTVNQLNLMQAYQHAHPNIAAASANTLSFGGGIDGIGVTSGTEKVYLVFFGTQWGTQSTDSGGNLTFSHDTSGAAPYLQKLFKGIGTGNELWSGTMTQYCDGAGVSVGATSCPAGAAHVGYPTGGALTGVWYDNSAAEPQTASGHQLAVEAINAAGHFGNTSAASNRFAQYVILSATGTNPDNWLTGGFCAWHDYNGDTTLSGGAASSSFGDIAFTNMPYVLDQGTSCGQDFVNGGSAGTLDGFSIVNGHEYSETVTDQNPAGGWTSASTGEENADECAWISSGQGASANVTMGNGTYAMQSSWSNDTNECDISHSIVTGGGTNNFSISASPSSLTIAQGSNGSSTISTAVTSGSAATVSLSASVSPSGPTASLSPTSVTAGGSATLSVSVGSSVATGSYTVTVTGTEGSAVHSTPVAVTVTTSGGGGNSVTNGGFETGSFSGWTRSGTTSISTTAHSGSFSALVGSTAPTNGSSSIAQTFTAASGTSTLTFWYLVSCPDTLQFDWATATLRDNTTGVTTTVLPKTCNTNNTWVRVTASITAGHSYTLTLTSHDDDFAGDPTFTLYDDVAVN